MNVHVLLQIDSYDRSEVLGVYATVDSAKRAAEAAEPGRPFDWRVIDGHPYASDGLSGPVYTYAIEAYEVRP